MIKARDVVYVEKSVEIYEIFILYVVMYLAMFVRSSFVSSCQRYSDDLGSVLRRIR